MTLVFLILGGFLTGAANSFAGAGSLFLLPTLLFVGLDPLHAVTSTALVTAVGQATSLFGYAKDIKKVPHHYFWLLIPVFIISGTASLLLINTPSHVFTKILPWLILSAVVLFAFEPQLHNHIHKPAYLRKTSPFIILAVAVCLVAFYGGYFGVGFGFIMLAVLSFSKLKNIYQINSFKNLLSMQVAGLSSVIYMVGGYVVWKYTLFAMIGALAGGYLGAQFVHKISPHIVRIIIVLAGTALIIKLFIDM